MAKRQKVSKSGSKKLFNKTSKKTHKQNVTSVTSLRGRGGRRL